MEYVTIFDYNWGRVWQFEYPREEINAIISNDTSLDESEAFEQWITEQGFSVNDIHYMFHADNTIYNLEDL
jgi:hypothetical protein